MLAAPLFVLALAILATAQPLPASADDFECCRIFITGITGMIGSHAAKALLSKDVKQGASAASFYESLGGLCKCRKVYCSSIFGIM